MPIRIANIAHGKSNPTTVRDAFYAMGSTLVGRLMFWERRAEANGDVTIAGNACTERLGIEMALRGTNTEDLRAMRKLTRKWKKATKALPVRL